MDNKSPAFQWYPKDALSSARIAMMSLAEEGAYRRLLDFCWINGSVPADKSQCARLIGKGATPEIAEIVLRMFIAHPNDPTQMIHDRLELERAKQEENRKARQKASEARWNGRGTPADARGKRGKSRSDADELQTESKRNANALQVESSSSSTSSAIASSTACNSAVAELPREDLPEEDFATRQAQQTAAIEEIAALLRELYGVKDSNGWGTDEKINSIAIELHGVEADVSTIRTFWRHRKKPPQFQYFAGDFVSWRAGQQKEEFNGNGSSKRANLDRFKAAIEI